MSRAALRSAPPLHWWKMYGRLSVAVIPDSIYSKDREAPRGAATEGRPYIAFLLSLSLGCVLAACKSPGAAGATRYDLKGKVVSFDKAARQITIAHDEIPGYMDAMTMPFTVKDDWVYGELADGDRIQAALVVSGGKSWLEEVVVSRLESAGGAESGKTGLRLPEPGDSIPSFSLINQDGKPIHIADYHGRALLITFIYTRCPLPDYCPLMTANFAAIDRALTGNPRLADATHLISITIDPEYDSPGVLRAYGSKYAGGFEHWEFATGSADEVKAAANWCGLSYWPENGQIIHALSTVLIGPDGKVIKLFRGNDWKVEDVLAEISKSMYSRGSVG